MQLGPTRAMSYFSAVAHHLVLHGPPFGPHLREPGRDHHDRAALPCGRIPPRHRSQLRMARRSARDRASQEAQRCSRAPGDPGWSLLWGSPDRWARETRPGCRLAVIMPPHLAVSADAPTTATLRGATKCVQLGDVGRRTGRDVHRLAHRDEGVHRHRSGSIDEQRVDVYLADLGMVLRHLPHRHDDLRQRRAIHRRLPS